MKSKIILLFLLFILMVQACQDHELTNEDKTKILDKWIPYFSTRANLSNITETERLIYSYQEGQSRVAGQTKIIYPPYFGGMYFCDRDNDEYVILLTDTSQLIKESLIQMCALTSERVRFKACQYSIMNYLICKNKFLAALTFLKNGLLFQWGKK